MRERSAGLAAQSYQQTVPECTRTQVTEERAEILYDFEGQSDKELSCRQGDLVTILDRPSDEWVTVKLNGITGLIPTSYIQPLSPTEVSRLGYHRITKNKDILYLTASLGKCKQCGTRGHHTVCNC